MRKSSEAVIAASSSAILRRSETKFEKVLLAINFICMTLGGNTKKLLNNSSGQLREGPCLCVFAFLIWGWWWLGRGPVKLICPSIIIIRRWRCIATSDINIATKIASRTANVVNQGLLIRLLQPIYLK